MVGLIRLSIYCFFRMDMPRSQEEPRSRVLVPGAD